MSTSLSASGPVNSNPPAAISFHRPSVTAPGPPGATTRRSHLCCTRSCVALSFGRYSGDEASRTGRGKGDELRLHGPIIYLWGDLSRARLRSDRAGGATFYSSRHECGAIMMADGHARSSGKVGVASVHQGPGFTNSLTGLTEAAKASTPLLVLAADLPTGMLWSNFKVDQATIAATLGAIPERVRGPETAAADAARALRRAQTERRPVVLSIPIDVVEEDCPDGSQAVTHRPPLEPPVPSEG